MGTPTQTSPVDLKDRASRAMRLIGVRHPHFLIAWRKVRDLVKVDPQIPTFAVDDRGVIYIGPAFASTLSPSEFGGVLVHELMHLALDHAGRAKALGLVDPTSGKARDPEGCKVWNIAGDWVINERLKKDGIELPGKAIYPPKNYPIDRVRTTEAFYFWILEQRKQGNPDPADQGQPQPSDGKDPAPGQGCGAKPTPQGDCSEKAPQGEGANQPGQPQGAQPGQGQGEGEPQPGQGEGGQPGQGAGGAGLSESEVRQIGREIRASARALGIGAGTSACLDALEPSESRLPWERLLRSGFDSANARKGLGSPTYSRRSRRSPAGMVLPGWITTDPKIAVMIDVSGSMDRAWVAQIVAEVTRLCQLYNSPCFLVTHTDQVTFEGWITPGTSTDKLSEAVAFSGGTKCASAYEAVANAGRFDVLVHFTDCEIDRPWPENPAKRLIVGAFGSGASGSPYSEPPEGAELVAISEGGEL